MRTFLLLLIAFSLSPILKAQSENYPNFINDSTQARYRFEEKVYQSATIPSGTLIEEIDISERDLLKPMEFHRLVCTGINNQSEPYFQAINIKASALEDWMHLPDIQLMSPTGSFGFDSTGQQEYYFPNNASENQTMLEEISDLQQNGFRPIMMFFPSKRDPDIQAAINDGASLQHLPFNAFQLSLNGNVVRIEPNEKKVYRRYLIDSVQYEVNTQYTLFAPYGYVPLWEEEKYYRLDLSHPVTFTKTTTFHNHVIEDLNNLIEKYTDKAHLEVYPNPVEDQFEILLRGIPDAQVSQVQVRDHLGNIIQTYPNPIVSQDIISIDGSAYPNGVLILIVQTQAGLFSQTFTKI
jgi:hypothetical protein